MGGNALIAFEGKSADPTVKALLTDPRVAGVTLYRHHNFSDRSRTFALTRDLVRAAGRPLLIGTDQEGGQLIAAGPDATPFAGNMALGATGDLELTTAVALATGLELRAMGINVNYAPVADIASRPGNPSLGIRSFGEDPTAVAGLVAAFVEGLQRAGVAATLKHFPGKGEATVDPHDQLPILDLPRDRLESVEFTPFRTGIAAGARLLMVGHYGLPAVTGDRGIPTSVSAAVLRGLIRQDLAFKGLVVTDALDMGGFHGMSAEAPLDAGADLLLYGPRQMGALPDRPPTNTGKVEELIDWLSSFLTPDLSVVGCEAHLRLADELAARSITLVRDDPGLLPINTHARVLAIMPRPADLTPADTSSLVEPGLARAIRAYSPKTTELVVPLSPESKDIADASTLARDHDVVVVGTIDAGPGQASLVEAIVGTGVPTVTVALRTPYDLATYPTVPTHLCAYGILPPTMKAVAAALFGAPMTGVLPVSIPGLYPIGHGEGLG